MISYMIGCLLFLLLSSSGISVLNVHIANESPTFAIVGESINMNCYIKGSYQSINWYAGNTTLSNGHKYQIIQSTSSDSTFISLVISDVQYDDAATYTCQAVSSIDGSMVANDSFTLSVRDKSSHLETGSSMMTVYYVIIFVLAAVILIMAILMIKRIRNCWQNRQAVPIRNYSGQHEIFNPADPPGSHERNILMEEGTGRKDNQREDNQGQRLSHPSPGI